MELVEEDIVDNDTLDRVDITMKVSNAQMDEIYFSENEDEEWGKYGEYATLQETYEYDPPLWMHQQIEKDRLRFKQREELDEIFYSDEEDDEDTIEDGDKIFTKQPNYEINDMVSVMLPTETDKVPEEEEGHNLHLNEMLHDLAALPFAMPRHIHPRGRVKKVAPKSFINEKRRELDGEHKKYWKGHMYGVSRREKDMIEDQCRASYDVIWKMMYDEVDQRMVPLNASSPTPRLDIEIERDFMATYRFNVLPDTGSTRCVVAKNIADKMG